MQKHFSISNTMHIFAAQKGEILLFCQTRKSAVLPMESGIEPNGYLSNDRLIGIVFVWLSDVYVIEEENLRVGTDIDYQLVAE